MSDIIPLDLNESYWLLDDDTYKECTAIPKRVFGTYPDYSDLIDDIARYVGVPASMIAIAPGSDEAIRASVALCRAQKLTALVPLPTFSGYERVLMELPLEQLRVYYKEENGAFVFPFDETLDAIRLGTVGALFLCQPNNPLGTSLDRRAMYALLDAARTVGLTVIVDEAYAEFIGESVADRVSSQKLIVLRSLSKAFGVPGIRIGYSISDPETARALSETIRGTLPWPIAGPSVHIARTVLAHADTLARRRALLIEQREKFFASLRAIKSLTVYPSTANFILVRVRGAARIADALFQKGMRVGLGERKTRDPKSKAIMADTLRLTVPSPEDMPVFLAALKKAVAVA